MVLGHKMTLEKSNMTQHFYIYGERPVIVKKTDNSIHTYAFNWESGEFELNIDYVLKIYFNQYAEMQEISEEEFWKFVESLRSK
ncbi:MAG: hypothetical protein IM638_17975 [Bacteroidetes bacterium]|nr:hypothetical protein [Bacteroidota bacterium]